METNHGLLDVLDEFITDYYLDALAEIPQSDQESLHIDFADLYRFDPDLADDFRSKPDELLSHLEEAVEMIDLPCPTDFSGLTVRVHGLNKEHIYSPGEVRKEQAEQYVGISGVLERVTTTDDMPKTLTFRCERCRGKTSVPQQPEQSDVNEPHECHGCERQGPFSIDHELSEWHDYAKIRIKGRPDASETKEGKLEGYVLDDLIDAGGGLIGRAGEPVTVYGTLKRVQKQGKGKNNLLFDHMLKVRDIEFEKNNETVDVAEHREEFEELASRPNAVDVFAESIAPNLHETDAWEAAFEFAVAYLFGAPRVDLDDGPTYRGDLHFLMITDYGMGKSTFKEDIAAYSPKCISKSTTALSSGVGLTAAAVKDDFSEGQWTIKPGLLVRANGGHLLLDELDKGPDELTKMNDALEGEQVVDVEKAGKSPTYDSKCGLMALGNPVDSRFNSHDAVADQLGISETLLSRFDGIVTMKDTVDEEQDRKVAETFGKSYTEAQQAQHGDREEFDTLDRPVPTDVGQAWVQYARENVNPVLEYEQFEELEEWYAEEVRQLNASFAGKGEGGDMPVPATVRVLGAAIKMALAFARARLQETVQPQQIERAKKLGKKLVKQHWNGENFDATKNAGTSQKEKVQQIVDAVSDERKTPAEIAEETGLDESTVEHRLDKASQKGLVYQPRNGKFIKS
jgi:replicative DNA helicase Mcm